MNALLAIEQEFLTLGYRPEAIIRDYSFADVLSAGGDMRRVELAAFTQMPESYRSAAFGVITGVDDEAAITGRRALGAPILFSISQADVSVWRVGAQGAPRLLERVSIDALPDLFHRNTERWRPQAVHRAKSLGQNETTYQLDFVDLGLLPAIEHEVEDKLDKLLKRVIECLLEGLKSENEEAAFRTTFRLLAAKILVDREHPDASSWRDAPVSRVLDGIEAYYHLNQLDSYPITSLSQDCVTAAWLLLREAINFRNISSDSLAFVYENTLVTIATRKRFGTHSTPRQVAEYVVGRLNLGRVDLDELSIFEPFTGAGSFLVAALRHLRDLLPENLTGLQRHAFLVPRIRGAEIDTFACEVATLSLILADYPNANGWKIESEDLFRPAALAREASTAKVILCNPPWEDFDANERIEYPSMALKSHSKPMAVLSTILDCKPEALGFVLPRGFLRQKQYAKLRQRIAEQYSAIELVSLPDRIFQMAGFETALLIAQNLRNERSSRSTKISAVTVEDRDRAAFLTSGKISNSRSCIKTVDQGNIWISVLEELWEYLSRNPRLSETAEIYRGLQWVNQKAGFSAEPKEGYVRGVYRPGKALKQFDVSSEGYLDLSSDAALYPGPLARRWDSPKVLANSARRSRGPWKLAAAFDTSGLVASQAFFGVWVTDAGLSGETLEAILNSPLTNAFLAERSTNHDFTNEMLGQLPLPKKFGSVEVKHLVQKYRAALDAWKKRLMSGDGSELSLLLMEIDAEVLRAYDLPPRLERALLEYFRGHTRPVLHPFDAWIPEDFTAYMPLHEYLGPLVQENRGPWTLDVFTPAPEEEVALFEKYVH